ncbi:MAG: carboxypeptidase-like regulatory domain-containing protein, partial [Bacteroidetes bacterium]|nr:carboxypeptidase-like regulatory domain-containing protein [Bacteroidota bacterium]
MTNRCFGILIGLVLPHFLCAQFHTVTGRVTDNKLQPLALATVEVKELKTAVLTQDDGSYTLKLEPGKYDLVVSMMGYKGRVITIIVDGPVIQNIVLDPGDARDLSEVVVRAKTKDRAEEFIRHVIQHKTALLTAAGAYSCDIYIRATQKDAEAKKSKPNKHDSAKTANGNPLLDAMSMAEISLHYDQSARQQVHEQRLGVSKRGNPDGLFYQSATDGDFNLYRNLVQSPALTITPFISPVSYSGLLAYRYRTISAEQKGQRKLYTIGFRPRQMSNATMEGQLVIEDSAWVILSASFRLPSYHLPQYDFFAVSQQYEFVQDTAWMITHQAFTYYSKQGKGKRSGETVVTYHHFDLNKNFPKNYFGNEISATTDEAYKRDSSFWQQTRTVPLSDQEIQLIRYKDSVYNARHTKAYLDSIDRVINKATWQKLVIFGQELYDHEKRRTWILPSLLSFYQPLNFGGTRINPSVMYDRIFPSKKELFIDADISYGIRNKDVNGSIRVKRLYNPFNRGYFEISGGREFGQIFSGDAWINQLKRSNVYLDNSLGIRHGLELTNGLFLYSDIDVAFRRSVSGYKTNPLVDSLFGDILTNNHAIAFDPYNAFYGKLKLAYTPGQRYIREPHEKIIL